MSHARGYKFGIVSGRLLTAFGALLLALSPHHLDIAGFAKPGRDDLEIRIATLWVNRLIGDARPGAKRIAFNTVPPGNRWRNVRCLNSWATLGGL